MPTLPLFIFLFSDLIQRTRAVVLCTDNLMTYGLLISEKDCTPLSTIITIIYLPWQAVPFPMYALSQVHKKDPSMLVQFEFW